MSEEKKPDTKPDSDLKAKSRFVGLEKEKNKEGPEEKEAINLNNDDLKGNSVKELLEKNLKWSQIIYEQNRKIKRTLTWNAVGSWIRIFLFLLPFVLAAVYLWPLYKNAQFQLFDLLTEGTSLDGGSSTSTNNNAALKSLLKVIPMSEEQQKQINALLDNNKQ